MFPVRYKLGSYIPEYGILHSQRRESLKSYIRFTVGGYVASHTRRCAIAP
jgi:hypothetical protein